MLSSVYWSVTLFCSCPNGVSHASTFAIHGLKRLSLTTLTDLKQTYVPKHRCWLITHFMNTYSYGLVPNMAFDMDSTANSSGKRRFIFPRQLQMSGLLLCRLGIIWMLLYLITCPEFLDASVCLHRLISAHQLLRGRRVSTLVVSNSM